MQMHNPPHPGRFLKETWIKEGDLTIKEAAEKLGVPHQTLSDLLLCKSRVSKRMAEKLAVLFDTSDVHWLNMQKQYDNYTSGLKKEAEAEFLKNRNPKKAWG